ncbi:hypothetical protein LguiA_005346 [Lonicera macranthoides]
MEFEDREEEHEEEETGMSPNYENPSRSKMPSPVALDSVQSPSSMAPTLKPRYRECLKNHAVGLGGHAVDGCCEFLAAGPEGTLDALKCAACNCHRNFHKKETTTTDQQVPLNFHPHHHLLAGHPHPHPHHHPPLPYYRSPSGYLHVSPRPLALPSTSGGGGGSEQEDVSGSGGSRKRHRTKFTQEQKDKMLRLAERLDWRIQKNDEEAVQEFCNDTGLKRHVLKVWMHNNKHTLGKKLP